MKKQKEELIDFKEEHHVELRKLSSGPIQNEMITINSEHPYSEDHFERKFQANIYPSEQSLEKPEESLIPLTKSDCDKLHSEMKSMNEDIATMLAKLHDKYDNKIEKLLQPMSVKII